MGIGTECGEYSGDVCTLKCISNLYTKESETKIPQVPKRHVGFVLQVVVHVDACLERL